VFAAARRAGVRRLVVVGGAGSLEVAPGVRLIDTPEFPDIYKNEALAHCTLLEVIRAEVDDRHITFAH
jgi:putative NADH-flavin reductase